MKIRLRRKTSLLVGTQVADGVRRNCMSRPPLKTSLFLLAALAALAACAPVPLGDGEKRVVVRGITASVISPALDDVVARAGEMSAAIQALADAPAQESLDAAQGAWRAARSPWKETEAFGFGPAADLRLAVAIDQSPVDTAKVDLEVAGTAEITEASVDALGANGKGFHAIEHLLFTGGLSSLTTDARAARRRELLVALSRNLHRKAGDIRAAWAADGGGYVRSLTEPGASNAAYPTIKSVLDALVNESVFLSELVANDKLGKPLGTATGGTPQPDLQESGPSDNSLADMAANLRGIRSVYLGTRAGGPEGGISQLVAARNRATDNAVRAALDDAIAKVEAIPRPYRDALLDQRPEVTAAYESARGLKRILATEVVAVLGATLKFNDNDGD